MKRLILMRHAKSDWSTGGADHQRPLNKRGRNSAKALGDWLRAQGVNINEALPADPALVLIAVKPQMMGEALPPPTSLGEHVKELNRYMEHSGRRRIQP